MKTNYTTTNKVSRVRNNWSRDVVGSIIYDFEDAKQSQRDFAKENDIAHSTLQHWLSRKELIDADPFLIDFFESPVGMGFLHRLITAIHLVFTKDGVASIHNISTFLELSELSAFVGSSYSTHQRVSKEMDNLIIEFEAVVKPDLARNMPAKKITLAEDETFHPEICAVAIEPVSNYIIVEEYVENRKSDTWNEIVLEGIKDLPVKVIQVTSDEGRGLINHTINGLKAHHSSDCFHVSHEIGKGTSGALASLVKKAEKEYESVVKQSKNEINPKGSVSHKPDFELAENEAKLNLETAKQNQETVRFAKREIGEIYHPYNLETGTKQDSQKISELLKSCFENIRGATTNLSEKCKQKVEKAYRVVPNMVATIAFFFIMIDLYMDNMRIPECDKPLMYDCLIPGFYLEQVAHKEKDSQKKANILKISQELLTIINSPEYPYTENLEKLKKTAKECAQIFQRSSSCVEGRNAQLSLRHHGIHRLSSRTLKAQTVIHNYYKRNIDGLTPAERFFEDKHPDLFEWLLEKMDYPVRPRKPLSEVA